VAALQARIDGLRAAELLSEDEVFALEDLVADFVELESCVGIVTLDATRTSETTFKLVGLVALSARIVADESFARQARRKYT
jgi:hypothetical protein